MGKVRVGFFSFTEVTDPDEHRSYNEWHMLDHMPEQYPIPGIVHGQRWVSTPACRASRAVDEERLAPVHYLTLYLMADPVEATLREFVEAGRRLRALGRFHTKRRALLSGPLQWLDAHASPRVLVDAAAVPYRPNQGVYVIVEEMSPGVPSSVVDAWIRRLHTEWVGAVCAIAGVAGVWQFATSPHLRAPGFSEGEGRITICYLDGPPLEVADSLGPLLEARWHDAPVTPVHAGPYETIVAYQWDWFDRPSR